MNRRVSQQRRGTLLAAAFLLQIFLAGNLAQSDDLADSFQKRAEQGEAIAQYNLGTFYYLGVQVPRDYEKAYYWLSKAAQQDIIPAQGVLGIMYFKGHGVPQDYQKAYEKLQQSAEKGYAVAQMMLSGMYYVGQGVPQDYQKAYQWAFFAAGNNNREAQELLKTLHQEMTETEIKAARKTARELFNEQRQKP